MEKDVTERRPEECGVAKESGERKKLGKPVRGKEDVPSGLWQDCFLPA